jgi:hypothetical protein
MRRSTVKVLALLLPALLLFVVLTAWAAADLYILFVVRATDPTFPTITRQIQGLDKGFAFLVGLLFGLLAGHFFLGGEPEGPR